MRYMGEAVAQGEAGNCAGNFGNGSVSWALPPPVRRGII